ncbi:MAG: hypothetical protein C4346_13125 [Chloroflexota bacterium]
MEPWTVLEGGALVYGGYDECWSRCDDDFVFTTRFTSSRERSIPTAGDHGPFSPSASFLAARGILTVFAAASMTDAFSDVKTE